MKYCTCCKKALKSTNQIAQILVIAGREYFLCTKCLKKTNWIADQLADVFEHQNPALN